MSTNKIEDLDEALIRAGRADRIINFTNTTKAQARDMFVAAYTGTRWQPYGASPFEDPEVEAYTEADISQLAQDFADKIRDKEFSPALLQQYFKDFRAQPRLAITELDKWMEDPRAYLKPTLQFSLLPPAEKTPRASLEVVEGSVPSTPVATPTEKSESKDSESISVKDSESSWTSTQEDLMSIEDLGGYKEPACFGRRSEDLVVSPRGPLLDLSLFAEAY